MIKAMSTILTLTTPNSALDDTMQNVYADVHQRAPIKARSSAPVEEISYNKRLYDLDDIGYIFYRLFKIAVSIRFV